MDKLLLLFLSKTAWSQPTFITPSQLSFIKLNVPISEDNSEFPILIRCHYDPEVRGRYYDSFCENLNTAMEIYFSDIDQDLVPYVKSAERIMSIDTFEKRRSYQFFLFSSEPIDFSIGSICHTLSQLFGSFSNKFSNLFTTTIEKSVDVNFFVHANNTLIVNSNGWILSGGASAILLNRNITLFNQILTNQFKNGNISTSGEAKASIIHDLEDKGIKLDSYKLLQNISLRKVKKQFISKFYNFD